MTVPSNSAQVQGQGSVNADQLNTMVQLCTTASQLRSFVGLPNMSVYLLGTNSVGDGNAGLFYWNPSSTAPDDNYAVIVPSGNSTGAWNRIPTLVSPPASVTPNSNGQLAVQATSNTILTFKYRGSDGTVRSGSLTLS